VHEHDGHRALAHRRGDPLGRLGPDVAGHEYARGAGLQVVRRAVKRPASLFLGDVGAGQDEAVLVTFQHAIQPAGSRRRSDKDEQLSGIDYFCRALGQVPERQLLQVPVATRLHDLGADADVDVGDVRDLLDEVVRHRRLERGGAHQHGHRTGEPRQVDGRLAGRVRAADHVHVLVLAALGLGERRAVVDARAGHLGAAGSRQLPVGDPGREDDRLGVDRAAVGQPQLFGRAGHLEAGRLDGRQQLGAELDRLTPRPVGELAAGQAVGEAQVVLDPRGLAGLAAGRELLH
jgi:hypothetical protein